MNIHSNTLVDQSSIATDLTFSGLDNEPFTVNVLSLALIKQPNRIIACRLTVSVSPSLYQRIDTLALFNLKPEIRGPFAAGAFQPAYPIQLSAILDPALLSDLLANATDATQATTYLKHLNQHQPYHPLFSVWSWYVTEVTQHTTVGDTGFRTLWYYLNPADVTPDGIDPETINQTILNFANEWSHTEPSHQATQPSAPPASSPAKTDAPATPASDAFVTQVMQDMTQHLEELVSNFSGVAQEAISETVQEVTEAFAELTESVAEIVADIKTDAEISLYDTVVAFFAAEDWPFEIRPDRSILRLAFQGKHGQWGCYATVREAQQQMVFYSIAPIIAGPSHQTAIAQFLTRANYGMIIGNFELDWDDGEIRYKTSIDVEGDRLSHALLKQLVYTNVLTMDQYLPGIKAVIETDISPEEAIRAIEQRDTATPDAG